MNGQTITVGTTEQRNPASRNLDELDALGIVTLMNRADHEVPEAIEKVLPVIAQAVDVIVGKLEQGGRLIYMGAGTSGRLGVLDAAECPPTFRTDPSMVVGLLAGGHGAMFKAVEGAEDSAELGEKDLAEIELSEKDVVVGIAASGRTPYVIGGLKYAKRVRAATIAVACNEGSKIGAEADLAIEVVAGPEVLTGSSRLKAGTSQKLVLNMLSTATMVRLGKVYQNLMVDVAPTNSKLIDRAARIVMEATGVERQPAEKALEASDYHAKTAIVMILGDMDADSARKRLEETGGFVRTAIEPTDK
ncbi:N-acetylmuramic acid 6-phosphate etherase [Corynebacterium endometrii]|uniref:N-acetylmuramic acid 6-phosphate etherase n=1 Tax=Corynebacterium endometrii TaxID=2488819 RepID=A0A4V1CEA1_9CORY|nr:N-acetylmuramic acid 6-phosphate etherase [Corynebacterium endometrii]QCB27388.1 N-acetylmuramic acid 6-phosphate etherase [Corynebacterium endometrii]